ncbi:MAG: tetratricopeptide repeat protein [Elusimicrobiota bacterium]
MIWRPACCAESPEAAGTVVETSPRRASGAGAAGLEEADRLYFRRDREGGLERSIALLEERLRQEPEDAGVLWRLGRGLVRLGEREDTKRGRIELFTRAEETIGRAVAIDPDSAQAHYWHGVALGRHGEARGMLRSLFMVGPIKRRMRRALELDPGHGRAHLVLGQMYRRLPRVAGGSNERAVLELETALRLRPNDTALHPALAEACREAGDDRRAREVLLRIFEVREPEDPAESAGNVAEARRMLRELGAGPGDEGQRSESP